MKIKEGNLKKIIRTTLINEIVTSAIDDAGQVTSANKIAQVPDSSLEEIAGSPTMLPAILAKYKLSIITAGLQLYRYMKLKDDAGLVGADKYFHFLAFYTAAQVLIKAGASPKITRFILQNIGKIKELKDLVGTGTSERADIVANNAGIEAAISGDDPCAGALSYAQGLATVGNLKRKAAAANKKHAEEIAAAKPEGRASGKSGPIKSNPFAWFNKYNWIWEDEAIAAFYGDDDKFIQPRHNCKLTPGQRQKAWQKHGSSSPSGVLGPLSTSSKTISETLDQAVQDRLDL